VATFDAVFGIVPIPQGFDHTDLDWVRLSRVLDSSWLQYHSAVPQSPASFPESSSSQQYPLALGNGGGVSGSLASSSLSPRPIRSIGPRTAQLGQAQHMTQVFQHLSNFNAAAIAPFSALLLLQRSHFIISAEFSPTALASPLIFFFLRTPFEIASSIPIGSWMKAPLCCTACNIVLTDWRKVLSSLDCASGLTVS